MLKHLQNQFLHSQLGSFGIDASLDESWNEILQS